MLGESDEFSEILKTGFPMYLLIAIPLLLVMSPVCPANAAHEFNVYRAQQYSLQGVSYGTVTPSSERRTTVFIERLGFIILLNNHRFKRQYY